MKMNGINQFGELAKELDISKQLLSKYLHQEGPIPNFPVLEKMAKILNTTPDFIDPSYRDVINMRENINKNKASTKSEIGEDYRDKYLNTREENLELREENMRLREELEKYRKN